MATSGIIFFDNGEVQMFGNIITLRGILQAINKTMPELVRQERDQLLSTINKDELKRIVERLSENKEE